MQASRTRPADDGNRQGSRESNSKFQIGGWRDALAILVLTYEEITVPMKYRKKISGFKVSVKLDGKECDGAFSTS
eukprot:1029550-Pyramimonas_sp.AAC.1